MRVRSAIVFATLLTACSGAPPSVSQRDTVAGEAVASAAVDTSVVVAPTSDATTAGPEDSTLRVLFARPLGGALGDWMRESPDEKVVVGAPDAEVGVAYANSVGPLRGIWCARSTLVVAQGPGWQFRRQAYFVLRPPEQIAPRGPAPEELRSRFCRLVAIMGEIVGDSAMGRTDASGYSALADWIMESTTHVRARDGYFGDVSPDGTGRGREEGAAAVTGEAACPDTDGSDLYYDEPSGPRCAFFFRVDTSDQAMGVSDRTQPISYGGLGGNLVWLAGRARFLSADDRATITDLLLTDTLGDRHRSAPDSATFQRLLRLHDRLLAIRGEDAPLALTLLDAAASRAIQIGRFGPRGDVAIGGTAMLRRLGVELKDWHLGGFSQDLHRWMDSALTLGPDPELGDSILVWHVVPGWPCGRLEGEHDWGIVRARPFTPPSRSAATRSRAWITMAQQWADSIVYTRDAAARAQLGDSLRAALRNGLEADPHTEYAEAAHHALWRAAAGLRPLLSRLSCDEGD